MYTNLHDLCKYNNNRQINQAILSNRHFLRPENSIYREAYEIPQRRVNFLPSFWGPDSWKFLETVAKGYSKDPTYSERLAMRRFLESLQCNLPCSKCRGNFSGEVEMLEDTDLNSPESVLEWLENLKNRISSRKNLARREGNTQSTCCGKK